MTEGFEASREAAAAIQADTPVYPEFDSAVHTFDYVAEARVTLSPAWHGDKVAKTQWVHRINAAIDAANQLDKVKKTLFYGRDNNLDPALGQMNVTYLPHVPGGNAGVTPIGRKKEISNANIIHAIIGMFTEAGEMLEALRSAINSGQPFDMVNLKEEVGDLFWYAAILAHEGGFTFDDAQRVNIAKLRARFPDRFTEFDANNRDLAAERRVLEGDVETGSLADIRRGLAVHRAVAEQSLPAHHRTRKMEGERNLDGDAIEAQKPGNNSLGDDI